MTALYYVFYARVSARVSVYRVWNGQVHKQGANGIPEAWGPSIVSVEECPRGDTTFRRAPLDIALTFPEVVL